MRVTRSSRTIEMLVIKGEEENAMSEGNGYANEAALVSTDWVAEHVHDPNLRLVEVDVDTAAYDTGHLEGAVGWHWQHDLQRRPVRDIPTREEWEALLGRSGIGNDTSVVVYGDNNNWFAAFAYWLFKLYGHQDVSLMNGGRKKWVDEGRPLTQTAPQLTSTTYHAREADARLRAYRDQVAAALDRADGALVDVRSPKEYSGELLAPENLPQEGAQRGGHIPGAQNIPWGSAVAEDGTFKPASELRALYGGKGVSPDKATIAYCRIGERSAHTWFVLTELLGYPEVRNYDGSWTEWGSLIGAPIER
jgi:thiosulfate/3-mercaptopyruvate sulfurtransferase